jgi:hypothetical protein
MLLPHMGARRWAPPILRDGCLEIQLDMSARGLASLILPDGGPDFQLDMGARGFEPLTSTMST